MSLFKGKGKERQWIEKQYRGLESYKEEIENGNYVFDSISKEFGIFCDLSGQILDIGCGIRSTLPYAFYSGCSTFIGIDPLNGNDKRKFIFIRAIGEKLPFKKNSFDHIIFATSLDHIIDPRIVLVEASRVLKEKGKIDVWFSCFDWIARFQQGENIKAISLFFWNLDFKVRKKDDFHFSHFTIPKIMSLLRVTGFIPTKIEKVLFDSSTSMSVFLQGEKRGEKHE